MSKAGADDFERVRTFGIPNESESGNSPKISSSITELDNPGEAVSGVPFGGGFSPSLDSPSGTEPLLLGEGKENDGRPLAVIFPIERL
jgi:hypothetical protein